MTDIARPISEFPLVRFDDPDHVDASMFLITEAELVDSWNLDPWLELLTDDVRYRVPVRTSRRREDPDDGTSVAYFMNEDRSMIELRIRRLRDADSAWSENPVSRTRHFVSNIRVRRDGEFLLVLSSLLLTRSRNDRDDYQIVSAERVDRLVRDAAGTLRLSSREVLLDQTRLALPNLPFPL